MDRRRFSYFITLTVCSTVWTLVLTVAIVMFCISSKTELNNTPDVSESNESTIIMPSTNTTTIMDFEETEESIATGQMKLVIQKENLERMLQTILNYPRNHLKNSTAKEEVRKYITKYLEETCGLKTFLQHFSCEIDKWRVKTNSSDDLNANGVNIIGILKGSEFGTVNDRPIGIGAHWDTVEDTPGTDDNGSGVAAMLEVARTIGNSGCVPKYTILFVAFDMEEYGLHGSSAFVKDYITNFLTQPDSLETGESVGMNRFQGIFVLDMIMHFDDREGVQSIPSNLDFLVPALHKEIKTEKYRGDFLALIYRQIWDHKLASTFTFYWNNSFHDAKFRLKPVGVPMRLKDLTLSTSELFRFYASFVLSDHFSFWRPINNSLFTTLPAVLLFDMGTLRGALRNCYHYHCDSPEYQTEDNYRLLAKSAQVLTDTLANLTIIGECRAREHTHSERVVSKMFNWWSGFSQRIKDY